MGSDLFEDRLRADVRRAAGSVAPSPRLAGLVDERIDVHERRTRTTRRGLAAALAAFVLVAGGVAVFAGDEGISTRGPGPTTPRTGQPGWAPIAPAPIVPRFQHSALWTGRELVVFGGYPPGGGDPAPGAAAFDPAAGSWRTIAPPPGDLGSPVAQWTGDDVLALDGAGRLHAWDPETDAWRELARSPFAEAAGSVLTSVWTGRELVVVGSAGSPDGRRAIGTGAYDPATDTWRALPGVPPAFTFADAVWTGREVVVVGDTGGSGRRPSRLEVWSLDPAGDAWERLADPPLADVARRSHGFAAWTGTELVVGGGTTFPAVDGAPSRPARDVAAYDPAAGTWRALPDAPTGVRGQDRWAEVWTGTELVVLAATDGMAPPAALLLLDPASGRWRTAPFAEEGFRRDAPMVWTGEEVLVWSGEPAARDGDPATCCTPDAGGASFTP